MFIYSYLNKQENKTTNHQDIINPLTKTMVNVLQSKELTSLPISWNILLVHWQTALNALQPNKLLEIIYNIIITQLGWHHNLLKLKITDPAIPNLAEQNFSLSFSVWDIKYFVIKFSETHTKATFFLCYDENKEIEEIGQYNNS